MFYDPPYDSDYGIVLFEFGSSEGNLLNPDGILIAEHHSKHRLPDAAHAFLRRWRILKQGETSLSFYERSSIASIYWPLLTDAEWGGGFRHDAQQTAGLAPSNQ